MKSRLIGLLIVAVMIASPFVVRAQDNSQSIADLQAQIAYLMEQIKMLQSQQNSTGTTRWCRTFNQNMGVGANDDEVSYLNGALMRSGLIVAGERNGLENENVFNENTAALVSRFQEKYRGEILTPNGLSAPTGYFGPATRAKMNSLYGCGGYNQPIPFPTPVPVYPLTVVSPNGGEAWQKGSTTSISVNVGGYAGGSRGVDLAVTSFSLNNSGPLVTFCNFGTEPAKNFPVNITINGVTREFDMAGYGTPNNTMCQTPHQWYYATWGLSTNNFLESGIVIVDPKGIYAETNEMNNKLTAAYNGGYTGGGYTPCLQGETYSSQTGRSCSGGGNGGVASALSIIASNPPNGAIDARKDSSATATTINGWRSIELRFSGDVSGITKENFSVTTSGGSELEVTGTPFKANTTDTLSVDLDRPIPVYQRTRITYRPTESSICLGYLPGDVDQSGMVAPADILQMADMMNGSKPAPLYLADIDNSGLFAPADQLAFTDLFNLNNGKTLPSCPAQ